MSDERVERFTIPAGTVIKIHGFPVRLPQDTPCETHPGNWQAIQDAPSEPRTSEAS